MKKRSLFLIVATLATIVFTLFWLWTNRGEENRPVFLTIEALCQRQHEKTHRWPKSFEQAMLAADSGERAIIDSAIDHGLKVSVQPQEQNLVLTYSGNSLFGGYRIRRMLISKDGRYQSKQMN